MNVGMVDQYFISKCYLATRPWSLPASLVPVLLGNILAWKESSATFNIWLGIATMLCVICVHFAGNLTNTYYDYIHGIDGAKSDDTTLVSGTLCPYQVLYLSKLFYLLAIVLLTLILVLTDNDRLMVAFLFTAGASLSFLYTGGLSLKYAAMGDVVILLAFGPIAALYGYVSHVGCVISLKPIFLSLPIDCLTEAILHINNCRDFEEDQKNNINTLAVLLGKKLALKLFWILLSIPFVCAGFMALLIDKTFLLTIVSCPKLISIFSQIEKDDLNYLPQETAKLNLIYGFLYLGAIMYSF